MIQVDTIPNRPHDGLSYGMSSVAQHPIVTEMMRGFTPIENHLANTSLNFKQKRQLSLFVNLLQAIKSVYRPYSKFTGKTVDIKQEIEGYRGFDIHLRGTKTQEQDGGHYLSEAERDEFKQTGVLGPFRVLSAEGAEALRRQANEIHARDYDGKLVFGNETLKQVLKEHNLWSLNYGGLYQALRYPDFWDLLVRPEITHRIASLLGDNIICWRSQFFEKSPGAMGTFWHQAGTFRESSGRPKLYPTVKTNDNMVQLTAWIALSDTTVKNGCMRLLPSSFSDSRFENFAWTLLDRQFPYLMSLDHATIKQVIHAMKFSVGNFVKAQMVFELAIKEIPDLFDGFETRDLEMKAGEFVIFTSLNTHGSYPNTSDDTRLALAGRYTTNDVIVYKDFETDHFPTPQGNISFNLKDVGCIQAHGEDSFGHNRIYERPAPNPTHA